MNQSPESSSSPSTSDTSSAQGSMLSADMEKEIHSAMESSLATHAHDKPKPEQFKAAHDAMGPKAIRGPRVVQSGREHRRGRVISVGPTDIFLEFGPRELGVLPRIQYKEGEELPKVADEVEIVVDKFDRDENLLLCSRPGLVQKADWEMLEPGQLVEARVTGVNKGGLELEVANHRAFMSASQVDTRRIEDLSVFVGEKLKCKVTRVDRTGRGNITLSRREIVGEERRAAMDELKNSLKEGDTREGTVRKIMPFGAFVDIGGVDGLVHISDVSHERLNKIESLKEGDKVTVKILKLDWENDRHSLGIKQLTEDPWMAQTKDVVEGAILNGKVTKLAEFGCFVEVAPGVEGLCHISELDWKRVGKTSDAVQPNKVVKVKVLKVEAGTRKISLSIKQAMDRPAQEPRAGGGGRGRGRQEEDTRKPEEILKETPALRRAREEAAKKHGKGSLKSGLGTGGGMGISLGDLKL